MFILILVHIFFSNKVVLTKFFSLCRMVWDFIWGTSSFYTSKDKKKLKRGRKSAIQPNRQCRHSISPPIYTSILLVVSYGCLRQSNGSTFWILYLISISVWASRENIHPWKQESNFKNNFIPLYSYSYKNIDLVQE